jgi:hypothetical protein
VEPWSRELESRRAQLEPRGPEPFHEVLEILADTDLALEGQNGLADVVHTGEPLDEDPGCVYVESCLPGDGLPHRSGCPRFPQLSGHSGRIEHVLRKAEPWLLTLRTGLVIA